MTDQPRLAPPDVLRAAADAADDAICRRLDHNQVIDLVADAVWQLAYEHGYAQGHGQAVAAVQRPDQAAYERGLAEGRRQLLAEAEVAFGGDASLPPPVEMVWGYNKGLAEAHRLDVEFVAGLLGHSLVLDRTREVDAQEMLSAAINDAREQGLRQATVGWEREWGVDMPDTDLVWVGISEADVREAAAEEPPGAFIVSRLVGPWEPAPEQPGDDHA